MRYFKFTFLFLLITYSFLSAQTAPPIQWQKSLGGSLSELGYSIQQTTDGGYIVAGVASSTDGDLTENKGSGDYWIVKLDSSGNIQWQKSLGGTDNEIAYSVQQTVDGGYIVAGVSSSNDGDVTGNHGSQDYWVVKLDTIGNIQWQKSLGGSSYDFAKSVWQTADGGYIVAGASSSNDGDVTGNHGGQDYWIVKLDANGNIQWQKALGGNGWEDAVAIQQTNDGGYIVAGSTVESTNGDVTVSYGNYDYWAVKLDINGNIQWQKSYGGIGDDIAYSIQQTTDGGYIIAGTSADSVTGEIPTYPGIPDYWIIKLDHNGNIEWHKLLGGSYHDNTQAIRQTQDGGYIVAGWSVSTDGQVTGNHGNGDYWIAKLNSTGNLQWQKSLGGSSVEYLSSIEQATDGGYIIVGYSLSTDGDLTGNHGALDYWVVKLASSQLSTLENFSIKKPVLYPNPAEDFIYVDHLPEETNVDIFDRSGRKLLSQKYQEEKIKINISSLINGTYIIQIKSKDEIILSKQIIVGK
ncbi:T9SS type A sorting domain-containing protein [Chryseobacterium sp. M5A1_1a]